MPSADLVLPKRMSRVAVVAPQARVRETLVALAACGAVELVGSLAPPEGEEVEALRRLHRAGATETGAALLDRRPDISALERAGESGLLEGEVELVRHARLAVPHGSFSVWAGWAPTDAIGSLNERLGEIGSAVVELPRPSWVEPPTLLNPVKVEQPFRPLVQSYGTTRYGDIDPTRSRSSRSSSCSGSCSATSGTASCSSCWLSGCVVARGAGWRASGACG